MSAWVPLTTERHGGCMWRRFTDYRFVSEQVLFPLAAQEVSHAALALPLVLAKDDDGWQVMACTGLQSRNNLCVAEDGRWRARYVPAAVRSYPFALDPAQADGLLVDEASGLLTDGIGGEPLFNEAGGLASFLVQVRTFLQRVQQGQRQLARMAQLLADADILRRVTPVAELDQPLYQVDEARWQKLADADVLQLHRRGAAALLYMQLVSQGNKAALQQWQQDSTRASSPAAGSALTDYLQMEPEYEWINDNPDPKRS